MPRKPNLFIIGAMKSGTSSLHSYLQRHPDIFMSAWKEPAHYSYEAPSPRCERRYLRLFEDARDERWVGESSTAYSKRPRFDGVPERLEEEAPDARFIYLVRDPFERLVSQYKHHVRTGVEREDIDRMARRRSGYLSNSYYAFQLEPYFERFGPDAVFVETAESLTDDPRAFLERLFAWLGVDPTFVPPNVDRRFHQSPSVVRQVVGGPLSERALRRLGRMPLMGRRALGLRRSLVRYVCTTRKLDFGSGEFQDGVERLRGRLGPMMAGWCAELAGLTGRSYDEWGIVREFGSPSTWAPPQDFWVPDEVRARATLAAPGASTLD